MRCPLFLVRLAAGFPSSVDDYIEGKLEGVIAGSCTSALTGGNEQIPRPKSRRVVGLSPALYRANVTSLTCQELPGN